MPRLSNPSPEARRRGEELVEFLENRRTIETERAIRRYLELRAVQRYRVERMGLVVTFFLPRNKLGVMDDVRRFCPDGNYWEVRPLPWWRWGRQVIDRSTV